MVPLPPHRLPLLPGGDVGCVLVPEVPVAGVPMPFCWPKALPPLLEPILPPSGLPL